jgi:UDP-2,3-diacylglucosamine hydrolase
MISLKDGSIFIADSHYNDKRVILFTLLNKIKNKQINTTQIFLMGDIFDFLTDEIEYFQKVNHKIILLINHLCLSIEIIYLEGNHDFNLSKTFPNIKIVQRENQPLKINHNSINISISHGDIFTPLLYNIYTKIIRNHYILKILNFLDFNNYISKRLEQNLLKKSICHKHKGFDTFIKKRVENYDADLIIEGHFHQGYISDKYINIPSLCCDKKYVTYNHNKFDFIYCDI